MYGNNTWVATGVSAIDEGDDPIYVPELRFSTDGSNWTLAQLSESNIFNPNNTTPLVAPLRIGSLFFDGTFWNVFVNQELPNNGVTFLYRHDAVSSLATGWSSVDITSTLMQVTEVDVNENTRFLACTDPRFIRTAENDIPNSINLQFFAIPVDQTGPVFTSPVITSYFLYQYIPIPTIQINATASGQQIYYFVTAAELPPGLSFNPITGQITGAPVQTGTYSVRVVATDPFGQGSILVLQFTVVIPRIIRKQDGAAAYTSLLRQYTEVLAAQSARDNRALPSEMKTLGEFMSPVPPSVVTASNCDAC